MQCDTFKPIVVSALEAIIFIFFVYVLFFFLFVCCSLKHYQCKNKRQKKNYLLQTLYLPYTSPPLLLYLNHVLLLASMSKRGWSQSASCCLCGNRVEDVDHVLFDCPALEDCRSPGWGCQDRSQVLWAERSVLVEAAMLLRVFLRKTKER